MRGDYRKLATSVLCLLKIDFSWNKLEKKELDKRLKKTEANTANDDVSQKNSEEQNEPAEETSTSDSSLNSDADDSLQLGQITIIKKGSKAIVKDKEGNTIFTVGKLGEMSSARFFSRVLERGLKFFSKSVYQIFRYTLAIENYLFFGRCFELF